MPAFMKRYYAGFTASPRRVEPDQIYTDEEREFLTAIDRYKRENRRPFPTWKEVLDLIKTLGYRKVLPKT